MDPATTITLCKENIQPLRHGRNPTQLGTALRAQEDTETQQLLQQERQVYEDAIKNYVGDDPLENWYEYILWVEQSYPKAGHGSMLSRLLQQCLTTFEKDTKYHQDRRFIRLWINHISAQKNPVELYQILYKNGIGTMVADLYRAWGFELEQIEDYKRADEVYMHGLRCRAEPREELEHAHKNFQLAVARKTLGHNDGRNEISLAEQRQAFSSLKAIKAGKKVGSIRTGHRVRDFVPGVMPQAGSVHSARKSNAPIQIYQDDIPGEIKGSSILDHVPIEEAVHKENMLKPGPWNNHARKGVLISSAVKPSFKVHEDTEELNLDKVKLFPNHIPFFDDSKYDYSVPVFVQDVPNPNIIMKPHYPKDLVYAENKDKSMEEIRAQKYLESHKNLALNGQVTEMNNLNQNFMPQGNEMEQQMPNVNQMSEGFERQQNAESERLEQQQRDAELERQRLTEQQQQIEAEQEKQRQIEQQQREVEMERQRQIEQQQREAEIERQIEQQQREVEIERQRQIEQQQREAEMERQRQIEQQQREVELQRQQQQEQQRLQEVEMKRQIMYEQQQQQHQQSLQNSGYLSQHHSSATDEQHLLGQSMTVNTKEAISAVQDLWQSSGNTSRLMPSPVIHRIQSEPRNKLSFDIHMDSSMTQNVMVNSKMHHQQQNFSSIPTSNDQENHYHTSYSNHEHQNSYHSGNHSSLQNSYHYSIQQQPQHQHHSQHHHQPLQSPHHHHQSLMQHQHQVSPHMQPPPHQMPHHQVARHEIHQQSPVQHHYSQQHMQVPHQHMQAHQQHMPHPDMSQHMNVSHHMSMPQHMNTSQHVNTSQHINTSQHMSTSGHMNTSQHINASQHINTSQHMSTSGHMNTSQHMNAMTHINTSQHMSTSSHMNTSQHLQQHPHQPHHLQSHYQHPQLPQHPQNPHHVSPHQQPLPQHHMYNNVPSAMGYPPQPYTSPVQAARASLEQQKQMHYPGYIESNNESSGSKPSPYRMPPELPHIKSPGMNRRDLKYLESAENKENAVGLGYNVGLEDSVIKQQHPPQMHQQQNENLFIDESLGISPLQGANETCYTETFNRPLIASTPMTNHFKSYPKTSKDGPSHLIQHHPPPQMQPPSQHPQQLTSQHQQQLQQLQQHQQYQSHQQSPQQVIAPQSQIQPMPAGPELGEKLSVIMESTREYVSSSSASSGNTRIGFTITREDLPTIKEQSTIDDTTTNHYQANIGVITYEQNQQHMAYEQKMRAQIQAVHAQSPRTVQRNVDQITSDIQTNCDLRKSINFNGTVPSPPEKSSKASLKDTKAKHDVDASMECEFQEPMDQVEEEEETKQEEEPPFELPTGDINPFDKTIIAGLLRNIKFPQAHHKDGYVKISGNLVKFVPSSTINLGNDMYDLDKCLGKGTYGTVFKGTDLKFQKVVALKTQKPAWVWEYYITREIKNRLTNPHMLRGFMDVQTAYIADNASVLVSEFSKYGTLLEVTNKIKISTGKPLSEPLAIFFTIEMLQIVEYLHKCQIIHADIKPDNFLLMHIPSEDVRPTIQLIDFGCSIDMSLFPKDQKFTQIIKTEDFTCIEMQTGKPWTYQTDLYCLAASSHCLLFGNYMRVSMSGEKWYINSKLPRYAKKAVWEQYFTELLNIESCEKLPDLAKLRDIMVEVLAQMPELQNKYRQFSNVLNHR